MVNDVIAEAPHADDLKLAWPACPLRNFAFLARR